MSPRRVEATELLKSQQRERILDAASTVFARHGLAATKISDIAKAAGVSHGLVPHYFGTKVGVFSALIERIMTAARELPRQAQQREGSAIERLRWFVDMTLLGVQCAPESFFLAVEAAANETVPAEVRSLVTEGGKDGVEALAQLIAEGQANGEISDGDPTILSLHVFALLQGLGLQHIGVPADVRLADAELVMRLLVRPRGE